MGPSAGQLVFAKGSKYEVQFSPRAPRTKLVYSAGIKREDNHA